MVDNGDIIVTQIRATPDSSFCSVATIPPLHQTLPGQLACETIPKYPAANNNRKLTKTALIDV